MATDSEQCSPSFEKGNIPYRCFIRFQSVIRCNKEVLHPKGFTFLQRASLTNKIHIKNVEQVVQENQEQI